MTMTNEYVLNLTNLRNTILKFRNLANSNKRKVAAFVLTEHNQILSHGVNHVIGDLDNKILCEDENGATRTDVMHAEVAAILHCDHKNKMHAILVTCAPCKNCAQAIIEVGIKVVYYIDSNKVDGLQHLAENNVLVMQI